MLNPYAFDAKFAARIGALDNGFAKSSGDTDVPHRSVVLKPTSMSARTSTPQVSSPKTPATGTAASLPDLPRDVFKTDNGGPSAPATGTAASVPYSSTTRSAPLAPLAAPPSLVGAAAPGGEPVGYGTVLAPPPSSGEPVGTGTVLAPPGIDPPEVDTPQAGWLDRLGSIPPWQLAAGVGATGLGLYGLRQLMRGDDDEEKKKRSS